MFTRVARHSQARHLQKAMNTLALYFCGSVSHALFSPGKSLVEEESKGVESSERTA